MMKTHDASYRDPSGFLYEREGVLLRQVNTSYGETLEQLFSSGLYDSLVSKRFLIPSPKTDISRACTKDACAVLEPELIPFISYPYEWCFDELKDAALLTLRIQKEALSKGMTLKDASAFNVQFYKGAPVFIDTLSFDTYTEGEPWVAYRQFIEHFLGPLLVMRYVDERLVLLHRTSSDGIPIELLSTLLPPRTLLQIGPLLHIHFQSRVKSATSHSERGRSATLSQSKLIQLVDHLMSTIESLSPKKPHTLWGEYYNHTNYDDKGFSEKGDVVRGMIKDLKPRVLWDVGANNGHFTQMCFDFAEQLYAFDVDYTATNDHYIACKKKTDNHTLPLVMDFTNPSSASGFNHRERMSLYERANADVVLSLAFIHHMTLRYAIPFDRSAEMFSSFGKHLVIEFPHLDDSQVKKLVSHKPKGTHTYSSEAFEKAFSKYFTIIERKKLPHSRRTLYRMEVKS